MKPTAEPHKGPNILQARAIKAAKYEELSLEMTSEPFPMCSIPRLNQNLFFLSFCFLNAMIPTSQMQFHNTHTHTYTHSHIVISHNTAAISLIDRSEMAPTTECEGGKQVRNNEPTERLLPEHTHRAITASDYLL